MSIAHLTFIDIETVSDPYNPYDENNGMSIKGAYFGEKYPPKEPCDDWSNEVVKKWFEKAGLHAEFGKIIAISIGKMVTEKDDKGQPFEKFYIRSLTNRNEAELLRVAYDSMMKAGGIFIAHNGLEFDFPFLMRRFMINGLPMPPQLDVAEIKPWAVKLRDTMKMWSGTAWNYRVSLDLLCLIFGTPSPKKDISGADVGNIYHELHANPEDVKAAMKKIGDYCAGDVLACAQVYCRMKGLPLIENVEYV